MQFAHSASEFKNAATDRRFKHGFEHETTGRAARCLYARSIWTGTYNFGPASIQAVHTGARIDTAGAYTASACGNQQARLDLTKHESPTITGAETASKIPRADPVSSPLPRFRRSQQAPRCLLQERDGALLYDVWRYRFLTTSQLELLRSCDVDPALRFVSRLTLTRRLKLLFHGKYVRRVARPSITGMQEPVYLLDTEGAKILSLSHGEVAVRAPSQLPKLAALEHTLAINQFRVSLVTVCARRREHQGESSPEIVEWHSSSAAKFSVVPAGEERKHQPLPRKVTLIPDGAFTLKVPVPNASLSNASISTASMMKLFFYLEVDLGSEVSRILTEKCRAYYAFWQSGGFAQAYSVAANVGFRVLFVAPTEKRSATILNAIRKLEVGRGLFWVALQDEIRPETLLRPIWRDAVQDERRSQLAG